MPDQSSHLNETGATTGKRLPGFTIRGKLTISTIMSIIIVMSVHTFLNLENFVRVYMEQTKEQIFAQTQEVQQSVSELLINGKTLSGSEDINRMCTRIVNTLPNAGYCFVIDNDGKMLYKHDQAFSSSFAMDFLAPESINTKKNLLLRRNLNGEVLYAYSFPLINPLSNQKAGSIQVGTGAVFIEKTISGLLMQSIVSALILTVFAGVFVFFLIHFSIVKSIRILLRGIQLFRNGELQHRITIATRDETCELASVFNRMADNILDLSEERKRIQEQSEETAKQLQTTQDALWGEMQLARKIQTVLLPVKPEMEGFEISAYMLPTDDVGGDYYDVISINDYHWIIIGDVSGHGVSAALIMMMTQTAIRTVLSQNPHISPRELLAVINKMLIYNIRKLNESKYMTLTAIACVDKNQFIYSGLHLPFLVYHAAAKRVEIMDTRGMWLGILQDINHINKVDSFSLQSGDILMLYTDGIIEARDSRNQIFTIEKLVECLKASCMDPIEQIKDSILEQLKKYTIDDDVTLLIVKKK